MDEFSAPAPPELDARDREQVRYQHAQPRRELGAALRIRVRATHRQVPEKVSPFHTATVGERTSP